MELVEDIAKGGYRRQQALLGIWMSATPAAPSTGLAASLSNNLIRFGIKIGGKTLQVWTFTTLLNVEIFRYSVAKSEFVFRSAFRQTARGTVVYTIHNIRYLTDVETRAKTGSIELVKDASGKIGWREVGRQADKVAKAGVKTLQERLSAFAGIAKRLSAFQDAAKKQQFLDDFATATDEVLRKLDANEGALVEAWKKINKLVASGDDAFKNLKKDSDFLKKFDDIANDANLNKHIFNGELHLEDGLLRRISEVHWCYSRFSDAVIPGV